MQTLNEDEIFQLSKKMMQVPPLATALFLHESICPLQSAHLWTSEAIQILLDLLLYNEIEVLVSRISEEKIQITCKTITDILVSKGLAKIEPSTSYPFSDFPTGQEFAGYIPSVTDSGTLSIQKEGSDLLLSELMSQMTTYLPSLASLSPEKVEPGSLVAALYECDQNFYRAQVLFINGDVCTVRYIDYGNEEQQDLSSIFTLPKQFSSLPYQAIQCELHNIIISPNKYSNNLKKCLMDKVDCQLVKCEIMDHVFKLGSNFSVTVKCQEENLSEFLVAKSFAKLRRCSIDAFVYQYVKLDEGSQHTAFISHVDSNGVFYVSKMSEAAKLDKLMDDLAEYCSESQMLTEVTSGMCCCALYDQDDSWYRALVKSVDGDECTIEFVDYGNTSTCNIFSLRRISSQFMDLSCQAIQCKILRELENEEIDFLQSKLGEMVEVKFLKKTEVNNSYHVKVVQDNKVLFPPLGRKNQKFGMFKKLKIDVETSEKLKILYFDSPEDMWGRLVSSEKIVQDLCIDLNKIYIMENDEKFESEDQLEIGTACIVQDLQYKQWCRGEVVKKQPNDLYSIRLVDVGIVKDYSIDQLRYVKLDQLYDLPAQALHFGLAELISVDMNTLKTIDLSSFFVDNIFSASFVNYEESNDIYKVELFDNVVGLPIETVLSETVRSSNSKKNFDSSTEAYEHLTKLQDVPVDGIAVEVSICFVEDPDCMWLQLQSTSRVLFQLLENMKAFYSKLPSNVLTFQQPHYDALCAVRVKSKEASENWYRGRILCLYADVIEVKLIDFGNEVKVKEKDIKQLSPNFLRTEPQSIKCKLFNVLPSSKKWTNIAGHELTHLANASSIVYATFVEKQKSCYVVDLELCINNETIKINEFLVKENIAIWQDKSKLTKNNNNTCEDVVSNDQNTNCNFSSTTVNPKIFYQSPGVAFIGAEIEVFASEVTSPDDFFLQINDAFHRQIYSTLIRDLNTACTANTKPLFEDKLYVGQPCAVFYERVQQWCRGAVLNYTDLENIHICLVDFGSVVLYPLNEVMSIDRQLVIKAPPEAMRCTLQGIVKPKLNFWCPEATSLCKNFFESDQRNLICTVHACAANNFCTYFICSVRTPLKNLADELIKAELGVKATTIGKVNPPLILKSFIYSNLNQVKGKEDLYFVVHIETPSLFYCQLPSNFTTLELMMEKLQLYCNNNDSKPVTIDELIQDCMCFAKFSNRWYRAHFIGTGSDDLIKVLFVDYGNTALVHVNQVQKFSNDEFYELPIQALPCSLKDIDATSTSLEHQKLLLVEMNNILFEKKFEGVVIGSTNGKLHLDLFHEGKRVNDLIVKNNSDKTILATEESNELYNSAETGHIINLVDPKSLAVGATFSVTPASCVSPNSFYLWLNLMEEERISCMDAIDGMYTAMRNADYKLREIHPGDIVCARRSKDMKWCRAKVVSSIDTDVEIFYVDTGETDTVLKAYDVKQLKSNFSDFPKMAVPCSISDEKTHRIAKWSSQAVLEFQYFVRSSQLTAEFLNRNTLSEKWHVKLMRDGLDFIAHLQNLGVALLDDNLNQKTNIEIDPPFVWEGERQVFISHVESETEIFVQDVNTFEAIEKLGLLMNEDKHLCHLKGTPDVHSFCLARFEEDNQLYRAKILSTSKNESFLVKFIDFGNTAETNITNLFILDNKYALLPQAAVYGKLGSFVSDVTAEEMFLRLSDLSLSDDVILLATFTQSEAGDVNLLQMKVQQKNEANAISLKSYFSVVHSLDDCEHTKSSISETDAYDLQYLAMKDILNQSSRSIYISHVENPGHIFCQLSEFCDELDALMSRIDSYYEVECVEDMIESTESLSLGSPCVAKYQNDNGWYRAVVEKIVDLNNLTVRFVDYGNVQSVSLTDIRKTKKEFCSLPAQALQCFVALVDYNSDSWSSEQNEEYDNRVASLQLKAIFTKLVDQKDNAFEVMLYLPDGTLLNNEYKKKEAFDNCTPEYKSESNTVDQNVLPNLNLNDLSRSKQCTVVPEKYILKHMNIQEGSIKTCFISYAENINIFYLQIVGTENNLNSLYDLASKDAQIKENCILNDNKLFQLDSFCVAKSPEDGEWYRGQIVKTGDKPTVLFVDYGNCAVLDWSFVKPITKDTAVLPIQAISCTFGNRLKFKKENQDEAIKIFFKLVDSASLTVCFLKRVGFIWEVSVMANGIDVAEKVITDVCEKHSSAEKLNAEKLLLNISPDTTLHGHVIYVTDVQNIFIKVDNIKTENNCLELVPCLVKQCEEEIFKDAVSILTIDFNDLVLVDGVCLTDNEIDDKKDMEKSTPPLFSVFHCMFDAGNNNLTASSATCKNLLLNKDVFVTFKTFNSTLSKWEVDIGLSISGSNNLFPEKTNTEPIVASKVDNVRESSFFPLKTYDMQRKCNTIEECLFYCERIFKQCKDLSADSPSEKMSALLNQALNTLSSFSNIHHDGLNEGSSDDHKRPFSQFLSIPAPCKKPKLDKHSFSNVTPVTHQQEQNKDKLIAFSISPSTVHHSLIFCVDSPDCFYVKPEFVTISLFQVTPSELTLLKNIQNHTFCAFCCANETAVKRGYIVQVFDSEVTVIDIDSGLEQNVTNDKVFAYPSQWDNQKTPVVKCSLFGLCPVKDAWSSDASLYFRQFIKDSEKSIFVKFIEQCSTESYVSKWLVDVIVNDQSLCELMVEKLFAVRWIEDIKPASPLPSSQNDLSCLAEENIILSPNSEQGVTLKLTEDSNKAFLTSVAKPQASYPDSLSISGDALSGNKSLIPSKNT